MRNIGLLYVAMTLPVLGQLIFPLSQLTKSEVRRYERCSFKRVRRTCSMVFNQICMREGLLPTHTNIYIYIYIRVGWQKIFFHANAVEKQATVRFASPEGYLL